MASDSVTYLVRAALAEDIGAPYLWLSTLPCDSRDIVKVVNKEASKAVWCEIVEASDNFIERYNGNPRTKKVAKSTPFLIANEWYRERLGIRKNESTRLEIRTSRLPLFVRQLNASYSHPDNTVRLAVDLAFVSVGLGAIGLVLGVISLCR